MGNGAAVGVSGPSGADEAPRGNGGEEEGVETGARGTVRMKEKLVRGSEPAMLPAIR